MYFQRQEPVPANTGDNTASALTCRAIAFAYAPRTLPALGFSHRADARPTPAQAARLFGLTRDIGINIFDTSFRFSAGAIEDISAAGACVSPAAEARRPSRSRR